MLCIDCICVTMIDLLALGKTDITFTVNSFRTPTIEEIRVKHQSMPLPGLSLSWLVLVGSDQHSPKPTSNEGKKTKKDQQKKRKN